MNFISTLQNIYFKYAFPQVFALIGKSGTGKSYNANNVIEKNGLEAIIDDGLLIKNNTIIAGKSAKNENGKISSIKTAIFKEAVHANEVRNKIREEKIKRLLIIGTSYKMVEMIVVRLGLPKIKKVFKIEDVASKSDIETAIRIRNQRGKHLIPASSLEIREKYPIIFLEPVRLFYSKIIHNLLGNTHVDASIVRPKYDNIGKSYISYNALNQIIEYCINEYNSSILIRKIKIKKRSRSYDFEILLRYPYSNSIVESVNELMKIIRENIEQSTGLIVGKVNIVISQIY